MSLHEYEISKKLGQQDPPFYALIMAAMRQADSSNLAKLTAAFPGVHAELMTRYHAPGGRVESLGDWGGERP
jgi:hypothetical protein